MIEPVSKHNLAEVLPLIHEYQTFYRVDNISDEKNATFFAQFGTANPASCQFIYRESNTVLGFATVYFSFASTLAAKIAILNDLYTLPSYRGQGVARKLIAHCRDYAKQQGAARLQWVTAHDNRTAQKLYDALGIQKSTWHFYTDIL